MKLNLSPTLKSRYDYYYSSMSPGSSAANFYENQNQSLFGDPVPPATDFLETLDNYLYGSLRKNCNTKEFRSSMFKLDDKKSTFGDEYVRLKYSPRRSSQFTNNNSQDSSSNEYATPTNYGQRRSSSAFTKTISSSDNISNANDSFAPIPQKRIFSSQPQYAGRLSNMENRSSFSSDSVKSNDWITSHYLDNRIHQRPSSSRPPPPPPPASKHFTEINHGDGLLALIQDSTTSTSSEQDDNNNNIRTVSAVQPAQSHQAVLPCPAKQPPPPHSNATTQTTGLDIHLEGEDFNEINLNKTLTPAIIRDTVTTGSSYRVSNQSRQHKKISFAIINEVSPRQSRPTSPSSGRVSPFKGKGFKPSSRVSSRATSPSMLLTVPLVSVDEPKRPSVQFRVFDSKSRLPQRADDHSINLGYQNDRDLENRTKIQIPSPQVNINHMQDKEHHSTFSVLPEKKKYLKPMTRRKLFNSTGDLHNDVGGSTMTDAEKLDMNPKRTQKGLMSIVSSSANSSPSKIPRRKSSVSDIDHISSLRRNSMQSNRRISITTKHGTVKNDKHSIIDLGVVSSSQSRSSSRISKPTTLSPILGTPNKDSEHSAQEEDTIKETQTKIPIRSVNKIAGKQVSTQRPSKTRDDTNISNAKASSFTLKKSRTTLEKGYKGKEANLNTKPPTKSNAATVKRKPTISGKSTTTKSDSKNEPANLKRENSTLKRETSNLKRTPSTLKRQTSKLMMTPVLAKNNSDSMLTKDKKIGAKEKPRSISESDGAVAVSTAAENLVPLTKSNVISMTTAAITAQPVQITTAVTNQKALNKTNSSGKMDMMDASGKESDDNRETILMSPIDMLEKSQKTLETIQKTVTEATDEIQKTIENNLTDLKSLELDMKKDYKSSDVISVQPPPILEKKSSSKSLISNRSNNNNSQQDSKNESTAISDTVQVVVTTPNTSNIEASVSVVNSGGGTMTLNPQDSDERVSERSISVLPEVDLESGNVNNVQSDKKQNMEQETEENRSENEIYEQNLNVACCKCSKCCTPCFAKFCTPCQRVKNSKWCSRFKKAEKKSTQTLKSNAKKLNTKTSCWKCLRCCSKKSKQNLSDASLINKTMATNMTEPSMVDDIKPGKCRLCCSKFLCCRKTNQIENVSVSDDEDVRKCCCFPCGKSKKENVAWIENRRESILSEPKKRGCCSRLCTVMCCRKAEQTESRRTSMNSKKQSIAPTLPPEDNRPKLDESLVDHTSMMKAAIPVLPVCLAWFCLVCNCFIPGLGTIFSGLFCLCLGIPRFSQHDGARARIGSFFINCIIGVAQAFCLLFCLVGWGWSIWWGTIMLKIAKKRRKLKLAEDQEMQEEETTSSNRTAPNQATISQNHRDVEGAA